MPKKIHAVEPMMLDARAVAHAIGISKTKLYGLIRSGAFPLGRKLSQGRVAWLATTVQSWCESRPEAVDPVRRVVRQTKAGVEA